MVGNQKWKRLWSVDLGFNEIGDDGYKVLQKGLEVSVLGLKGNKISEKYYKEFGQRKGWQVIELKE